MSLDAIEAQIKQKMQMAMGLSAQAKFDFGDDGVLHVDTTVSPAEVTREDKDADVTLVCKKATFEAILAGTQDPNIAFMLGKLKVKGSMKLAMKLSSILED